MDILKQRKTCYHCKGQKYIRGRICHICQGHGWYIPIPETEKEKKSGPVKKSTPKMQTPEKQESVKKSNKAKLVKNKKKETAAKPKKEKPSKASKPKTTKNRSKTKKK